MIRPLREQISVPEGLPYSTVPVPAAEQHTGATVQTRNSYLLGAAIKSVNTGVVIGDKLDNQIFGLSQ